ncbi:MAG: hypothetical protein DRP79_07785, partial [Planctomycetota bacterium]
DRILTAWLTEAALVSGALPAGAAASYDAYRAVEALPRAGGASDQVIRVLAEALEDKGERRCVASAAADILWRSDRAPTVALPESL